MKSSFAFIVCLLVIAHHLRVVDSKNDSIPHAVNETVWTPGVLPRSWFDRWIRVYCRCHTGCSNTKVIFTLNRDVSPGYCSAPYSSKYNEGSGCLRTCNIKFGSSCTFGPADSGVTYNVNGGSWTSHGWFSSSTSIVCGGKKKENDV
jgi:hypothetical protein